MVCGEYRCEVIEESRKPQKPGVVLIMTWWNTVAVPILIAILGGVGVKVGEHFIKKKEKNDLTSQQITLKILDDGKEQRDFLDRQVHENQQKLEQLQKQVTELQAELIAQKREAWLKEREMMEKFDTERRAFHNENERLRLRITVLVRLINDKIPGASGLIGMPDADFESDSIGVDILLDSKRKEIQ